MDKMKNRIEIKPDIEDGDVGLDPEIYLKKENHKLRITSWIDGDIYEELNRRADAGECNGKYQKLMNALLRKALFESPELGEADEPAVTFTELWNLVLEKRSRGKKSRKKPEIDNRMSARMTKTPQLYAKGKGTHAKSTKKKSSHG